MNCLDGVVERDARPPMIGKASGLTPEFLTPEFLTSAFLTPASLYWFRKAGPLCQSTPQIPDNHAKTAKSCVKSWLIDK